MMGNVSEWMESPWNDVNYDADIFRGLRGGECNFNVSPLASSERFYYNPKAEDNLVGFRVASVPEPATMAILGLGGLFIRRRRRA
ncbi:hypothetical protein SMSP1_01551 [Sedimentisphaera salicampi]|nr:hypothetical protein SMSP1_01551 [Sedimentisphaera salicampi]